MVNFVKIQELIRFLNWETPLLKCGDYFSSYPCLLIHVHLLGAAKFESVVERFQDLIVAAEANESVAIKIQSHDVDRHWDEMGIIRISGMLIWNDIPYFLTALNGRRGTLRWLQRNGWANVQEDCKLLHYANLSMTKFISLQRFCPAEVHHHLRNVYPCLGPQIHK